MSRLPHSPGSAPLQSLLNQRSGEKIGRETASEHDFELQASQLTATPPALQQYKYRVPSPSGSPTGSPLVSPTGSPAPESRPNLDILIAKTDELIQAVLTYKQIDFAYLFHQQPGAGDRSDVPTFELSLPGSYSDFFSLSEHYYTYHKAAQLCITFDTAINHISISPRFMVGSGETALHRSIAHWASYIHSCMGQGRKPFLTPEESRRVRTGGGCGITLPSNRYVEEGEGVNLGKKVPERYKSPDQAYWVKGMEYPSVVFEAGWAENMEELQRDARQWLARTHHSAGVGAEGQGVRVVILAKIWEVKGEGLQERERRRKKVLANINGNNTPQEDDLELLMAVEEGELLQDEVVMMNIGETRAEGGEGAQGDMDDADDYFDYGSKASFASNPESTSKTWKSARAKINVDSWVGTVHCVMHVWRCNHRTNAPGCASKQIILPRPEEGQNDNTRPLALWKKDIFPGAVDDNKRFVLDVNELREDLDEARKEYAFQRLLGWRELYFAEKHGREWREEYRHRAMKGRADEMN